MAKRYIFIRMPEEIYKLYCNINQAQKKDISRLTGKPLEKVKLPMTKTFMSVASPQLNENFIQIDLRQLIKLARLKK